MVVASSQGMLIEKRNRILVVDPDPMVLRGVEVALAEHFLVDLTTNLETAQELISTRRYDAIVSDWEEHFGDSALGTKALLRHCWPELRRLRLSTHIAPHLATLTQYREGATVVSRIGVQSGALLKAMVASVDDPFMASPNAN